MASRLAMAKAKKPQNKPRNSIRNPGLTKDLKEIHENCLDEDLIGNYNISRSCLSEL